MTENTCFSKVYPWGGLSSCEYSPVLLGGKGKGEEHKGFYLIAKKKAKRKPFSLSFRFFCYGIFTILLAVFFALQDHFLFPVVRDCFRILFAHKPRYLFWMGGWNHDKALNIYVDVVQITSNT